MDGRCGFGLVALIQLVDPSAIPVRSTIPALVCYLPGDLPCRAVKLTSSPPPYQSPLIRVDSYVPLVPASFGPVSMYISVWVAAWQCLCLRSTGTGKGHIGPAAERVKPVHTKYTSRTTPASYRLRSPFAHVPRDGKEHLCYGCGAPLLRIHTPSYRGACPWPPCSPSFSSGRLNGRMGLGGANNEMHAERPMLAGRCNPGGLSPSFNTPSKYVHT